MARDVFQAEGSRKYRVWGIQAIDQDVFSVRARDSRRGLGYFISLRNPVT